MPSNRLRKRGAAASADGHDARPSYWLRVKANELQLVRAETLIGRSHECAIKLSDPMVSRRHARILLEHGVLRLEDLGSCHGTFINQRLVREPTVLLAGDKIVVGSCTIDVVCRSLATPGSSSGFAILPTSGVRLIEAEREAAVPDSRDTCDSPTGVSEYLTGPRPVIFPPGMLDTASATLASHVQHLLNAIGREQPVPDAVIDTAGWYCVKMGQVTHQSRWLDAAVQLHLAGRRIMRDETLAEALRLTRSGVQCDLALVRNYIRAVVDDNPTFADEERQHRPALRERLAALAPPS